jgi:hypothetical protein
MNQSILNYVFKISVATGLDLVLTSIDYYSSIAMGIDDVIMPVTTFFLSDGCADVINPVHRYYSSF